MSLLTIAVTLPEALARTTLAAAEAVGLRTGETAIALQHHVIISERCFEALLSEALGWREGTSGGADVKAGAGAATARPGALNGVPAFNPDQEKLP